MASSDVTETFNSPLGPDVRFLGGLLDNLDERILVLDGDGTIVHVNQAWRSFASRNQVPLLAEFRLGANAVTLCRQSPSMDALHFLAGMQAVAAQRIDRFEMEFGSTGGDEQHWFQGHIKRFEVAAAVFLVLILHDVTRHKRLAFQQESFRTLVQKVANEWYLTFDAITLPIFILDQAGGVVRLNQAALALCHLLRFQDAVGRLLTELDDNPMWEIVVDLAADTVTNRCSRMIQWTNATNATSWEITTTHYSSIEKAGHCAICVLHDITRLVQLRESFRHNEHLAALGRVIGGLAHQIRNPLFGISATLDAFEARYGHREELKRYITVLRDEVGRIGGLLHELVEYGMPLELHVCDGSLADVIEKAVADCRSLASATGIAVESRFHSDIPNTRMDLDRMTKAFRNLIDNALQYSPSNTTIGIDVSVRAINESRWVECTVRDVGPGFSTEDLDRVFEPFFTRRPGKIGLGLAAVRRVVAAHGGKIFADNGPTGGGVVTVLIPIHST